jgi:hypothetical protein
MLGVFLQPPPEKRVSKPLFRGVNIGDSAKPNLGIQVLVKVEVERTFEFGGSVRQSFVFLFELRLAENDGDTFFICRLWSDISD